MSDLSVRKCTPFQWAIHPSYIPISYFNLPFTIAVSIQISQHRKYLLYVKMKTFSMTVARQMC